MWLLSDKKNILINLDRINLIYIDSDIYRENYYIVAEYNNKPFKMATYNDKSVANRKINEIYKFIKDGKEKIFKL